MLLAGLGGEAKLSADRLAHFIERQKDRAVAELVVGPSQSAGFIKMLTSAAKHFGALRTMPSFSGSIDLRIPISSCAIWR